MKYSALIWGHFKQKKLRTALTVLSIAVAFLLYGLLSAIEVALSQGVEIADADRLIVRHKVSIIQLLPESYRNEIARIDGVAEVTHSTWFGGIYQDPKNFFAQLAVEPERFLSIYPEFALSPAEREAWLRTRTGAIVGPKTAARFGWEVGDRIPIQATIWYREGGQRTWEFDLVGIYEAAEKGADETQFLFRYDYFDEARMGEKGMVGWYIVRVEDPEEAAAVAERIDAEFANSPAETKAEPEGAFVQAFAQQVGNITLIIMAILGAVFFTILLVAGNTMAQAVRERILELGVLKAIGFTHTRILGLILAESCLVAGLGGALGLGGAWIMIAAGDPTAGLFPVFYFPVARLWLGVAMAIFLGVMTGALPAWQGMRLQVTEALRRT